jgi:hypothetical protein
MAARRQACVDKGDFDLAGTEFPSTVLGIAAAAYARGRRRLSRSGSIEPKIPSISDSGLSMSHTKERYWRELGVTNQG